MRATPRRNGSQLRRPAGAPSRCAGSPSPSSSSRRTTAERASITSRMRGSRTRPGAVRSGVVTSAKGRPPATTSPRGPTSGSAGGRPVIPATAAVAIRRAAAIPIGVMGRTRPCARLMQK
ncbi:hypothetical protein ACFQV8_21055 [Pseudonocardia benzenivorans]